MLADVVAAAHEVGPVIIADSRGQGPAVEAALSDVRETPVLVVNADLPAVTPRDLVVWSFLMSSAHGPGSAERFLALAPSRLVEIPNLTEDVDTVDDLERLELRLGANTRAAVDSLRSGAR